MGHSIKLYRKGEKHPVSSHTISWLYARTIRDSGVVEVANLRREGEKHPDGTQLYARVVSTENGCITKQHRTVRGIKVRGNRLELWTTQH